MLYMYLNIFFIPFCYTNTLNPLTYNSSSFLVKWHPKTASSSANNANPNSTAGIQSCHLQDSPGLDTEKQPDIKKRATPNRAPSNQGSSETLNLKKEKTSLEAAFEVQKRAKNKKTVSLLLQSFIEIWRDSKDLKGKKNSTQTVVVLLISDRTVSIWLF